MKQIMIGLLCLMVLAGCQKADRQVFKYDFETNDDGFAQIYGDYHDDGNGYTTYEFAWGRNKPDIAGATQALYIEGMNRSDDLFMGYTKLITGLKKNTTYTFLIKFKLGTSEESGSVGVGGSPADSVYVKAGVVGVKPVAALDDQGVYRLNVDIGNQSEGGETVVVATTMAKPEGSATGMIYKDVEANVTLKSTSEGTVYLLIGTDSAYEGFTKFYLDKITVIATQK